MNNIKNFLNCFFYKGGKPSFLDIIYSMLWALIMYIILKEVFIEGEYNVLRNVVFAFISIYPVIIVTTKYIIQLPIEINKFNTALKITVFIIPFILTYIADSIFDFFPVFAAISIIFYFISYVIHLFFYKERFNQTSFRIKLIYFCFFAVLISTNEVVDSINVINKRIEHLQSRANERIKENKLVEEYKNRDLSLLNYNAEKLECLGIYSDYKECKKLAFIGDSEALYNLANIAYLKGYIDQSGQCFFIERAAEAGSYIAATVIIADCYMDNQPKGYDFSYDKVFNKIIEYSKFDPFIILYYTEIFLNPIYRLKK